MVRVETSLFENGKFVRVAATQLSLVTENGLQFIHIDPAVDLPPHTDIIRMRVSSQLKHINLDSVTVVVTGGDSEHKKYLLKFDKSNDCAAFGDYLSKNAAANANVFDNRTEETSSTQYFQFYAALSQQQNMLQDYVRTSTYQQAIFQNPTDFVDKVVLDVGAGSGILSFFAAHCGARKVFAVEASSMAAHCRQLVSDNGLDDVIKVIEGKIEEIQLPEPVDTIISEPIGYMLFNERMLETYLHAKKWLKPDGAMFPTEGHLYVAPFSDESLYLEMVQKANFWCQDRFYGINLSCLRMEAFNELIKQPIVDTFDIKVCMAPPEKHRTDFLTASEAELQNIVIPVRYQIQQTCHIHGLAFWFDILFIGATKRVWLSTSPTEPLTHWYQVRCLLPTPLLVSMGQTLVGKVTMRANSKQSYDVHLSVRIEGLDVKVNNVIDLKTPYFRYTAVSHTTPNTTTQSPTEQYYQAASSMGISALQQMNVNGGAAASGVLLPQYLNQLTSLNTSNSNNNSAVNGLLGGKQQSNNMTL